MNKITQYIQTYLLLGFPFVIVCMLWKHPIHNGFMNVIYEMLAWNLIFWFFCLTSLLLLIVISPTAREKTLRRLANIKDRDEREQYITGKASKATYIATLSLLIFLFFSSVFSVEIYRKPENQVTDGKYHTLSLGVNFSLFDETELKNTNMPTFKNSKGTPIFESQAFSLSKSVVILILIFWHLIIFNIFARKEQLKHCV